MLFENTIRQNSEKLRFAFGPLAQYLHYAEEGTLRPEQAKDLVMRAMELLAQLMMEQTL